MEIKRIPIAKIKAAKYNPRLDLRPGDPEYEKIAKSINAFDLVEPLVWNKHTGNLVGGHQRLKILKERGDTEVEVSVVDLKPQREKALNLALNKTGGDWDFPKLKDLLEELDTGAFDMDITGFDAGEIEALMTQFHVDGEDEEDEVPELPEEPETKPGDLLELGPHRVLCGDSTDPYAVDTLLAGAEPILMATDPPYGVSVDHTWRAGLTESKGKPRTGKVANDDRQDWSQAYQLSPSCVAYVWHSGLYADVVKAGLVSAGYKIRNQIIWVKGFFAMSRGNYHWKHEPCWYAVRDSAPWYGGRKQSTVWEVNSPIQIYGGGGQKKKHRIRLRNHCYFLRGRLRITRNLEKRYMTLLLVVAPPLSPQRNSDGCATAWR